MLGEKFSLDTPELSSDLEYLLQSKQVGQVTLVTELTKEVYAPLYALSLAILGNPRRARQVTCQTIAEAVLTYDHYRPEVGVKTWLYGLAITKLRRSWKTGAFSHPGDEFQRAFARLKLNQQLAILMYYGHRLGLAETALALGEEESSARDGLKNALAALPPFLVEEDLPPAIETHWPIRPPSEDEFQSVEQSILSQVTARQWRRRFSLRVKELGLGTVALLAAIAFAVYVNRNEKNVIPPPTPTRETVSLPREKMPARENETITYLDYPGGSPTVVIEDSALRVSGSSTPQPFPKRTPVKPSRVSLDFTPIVAAQVPPEDADGLTHSGATSLALALQFQGWKGDPQALLNALQPNPLDRTLLPYELENYISDTTEGEYLSLLRFGGTADVLINLLTTGTPVIIQRGRNTPDGWIGRYEVIGSYENEGTYSQFTSWIITSAGLISQTLSTNELLTGWRAFNYAYLIVYPAPKNGDILHALNEDADEQANLQWAANLASKEIYRQIDKQYLFFAWFNRGVSLAYLDDYNGAANAFDEAAAVFKELSPDQQPIALYWHQTRPYWAYYYSGRYKDVVALADFVLAATQDNPPEEAYYWRALAREAQGDIRGAKADLQQAIALNPRFSAGLEQLQRIENGG